MAVLLHGIKLAVSRSSFQNQPQISKHWQPAICLLLHVSKTCVNYINTISSEQYVIYKGNVRKVNRPLNLLYCGLHLGYRRRESDADGQLRNFKIFKVFYQYYSPFSRIISFLILIFINILTDDVGVSLGQDKA